MTAVQVEVNRGFDCGLRIADSEKPNHIGAHRGAADTEKMERKNVWAPFSPPLSVFPSSIARIADEAGEKGAPRLLF